VQIGRGKNDKGKFLGLRDLITIQRKSSAKAIDDVAFRKEFFSAERGNGS
jgi:hypothetical protein